MIHHRSVRNAVYAVVEYAAPQLVMLLIVPLLLRRLGAAQVGIWMLATAVVSGSVLISAGFGDAAVKFVAMYRGRDEREGIERVLRSMLLVNLCFGALLAGAIWLFTPLIVAHMAHMDAGLQPIAVSALHIGCLLLLVRSVDGVFVSVLRGMEEYAAASRITLGCRLGMLVCAAALAERGQNVLSILMATLIVFFFGLLGQAVQIRRVLPSVSLLPSLDREAIRMLAGYGCFTWLQVIAAILFGQVDRLLVGFLLGPVAVAYYSICTQAAQPIHGLVSAGAHALFPNLSARMEREGAAGLRSTVLRAPRLNVLLSAALTLPLVFGSRWLLKMWMGAAVMEITWLPLSLLALSFGLLALNVTAHFALLAIGEVRQVTWLNLAAAASTLGLMVVLMPRFGLAGAAGARLIYGPVTLLLYMTLFRRLWHPHSEPSMKAALQEAA